MSFKQKVSLTFRGYKTIHELVPGMLGTMILETLFSSILPFINIFMSSVIITAFTTHRPLSGIVFLAILTAILNVGVTVAASGFNKIKEYYIAKFWIVNEKPIKDKIQAMDYELVEDVETHLKIEHLHVLKNVMGYGLTRLYFSGNQFIKGVFKVVCAVSLLATAFTSYHSKSAGKWEFIFSPVAVLGILMLMVINVLLSMYFSKKTMAYTTTIFSGFEQLNRMGGYYMSNLFNYRAGKDLKLYELYKPISKEFSEVNQVAIQTMHALKKVMARNTAILETVNTAVTGTIYCYVSLKALFGSFGIGNIVQYVGSLLQLNTGITNMMEELTLLDVNTEALRLYFEFVDMPDAKYQGTLPIEKRSFCDNGDNEYVVEFKNVSFKYPGTSNYVLKNLNLKFGVGERLAVVGMNGSGKTTMIKLLCRLYDPTEGEITLNGIDIKKYDYNEYMRIFSVVFQDFKLFSFSLGQNVSTKMAYDKGSVEACLKKAGFDDRMQQMKKGIDTCIYKDFEEDGVEISGGEAQKIALARALYKNAPFIILDEPTATLDPIAEFEVYAKFNEIVGNKTAIYISHRLSSCRFCDDIAVFHEGEIVQRGNHDTLIMDEGGKYFALWNAQAQYYA